MGKEKEVENEYLESKSCLGLLSRLTIQTPRKKVVDKKIGKYFFYMMRLSSKLDTIITF